MRIDAVTEREAVETIIDAAVAKGGHWAITANLDHLRRFHCEPLARHLLESADLVVADGAPLVWASRIAATPLPERVAGSDMVWRIGSVADDAQLAVYLLGGNHGVADRAAAVLKRRYPTLRICGTSCPPHGFETDEHEIARVETAVARARPDIVLVALGFPKQDILIERLRALLPATSLVGVGMSLSFVAGDMRRSPRWTRKLGLEWLHRLAHEPRRLARRYLAHGVPFALRLFASAARYRARATFTRAREAEHWGWDRA